MAKMKEGTQNDLTGQKEIEVLYLGIGTDSQGKPCDRWYYLGPYPEKGLPESVGNDGRALKDGSGMRYDPNREWLFQKFSPPPGIRPGAIVKIKALIRPDGSTTIWSKPCELVEMWQNEADVIQWTTKLWHDRSFQRSQTARQREASRNLHLEKLEPFRAIYMKLPPTQQPLFLANVIAFITRGVKPPKEDTNP